jgi:predicted nucleic acid-binding protein
LSKPEVKEALMLPKQKAVKMLQKVVPEQHIEDTEKVTCKFAVSQHKVIQDAYEVFKRVKDEHASFEEFLEFCVSEWVLSTAGETQ